MERKSLNNDKDLYKKGIEDAWKYFQTFMLNMDKTDLIRYFNTPNREIIIKNYGPCSFVLKMKEYEDAKDTLCGNCLLSDICGEEDLFDSAIQFCAHRITSVCDICTERDVRDINIDCTFCKAKMDRKYSDHKTSLEVKEITDAWQEEKGKEIDELLEKGEN